MNRGELPILFAEAATYLPERERLILTQRLGLLGEAPATLQQVGDELGISRERVRQLQVRAVRRLCSGRWWQRAKRLYLYQHLRDYVQAALGSQQNDLVERLGTMIADEFTNQPNVKLVGGILLRLGGYAQAEADALLPQLAAYLDSLHKAATQQVQADDLISAVIWPPTLQPAPLLRGRQREVSFDGDGVAGEFWSDKLGRSVAYESLLECNFLLRLERTPLVTHYQEQPLAIPYELAGRSRLYYPDVYFVLADGRGVVAEVKSRSGMVLAASMVKWRVLRQFCEEHGYGRLITDGRHTIQFYWQQPVPTDFTADLLARLQTGPLYWPEYRLLREQHAVTWVQFVTVVLRHQLRWTLAPFSLTAEPSR